MPTGIDLIRDERTRQIEEEGWTPEHDAEHGGGDLAEAAAMYVKAAIHAELNHKVYPGRGSWPWDAESWKPSADPVRNLVKAGALIAAEIDRINGQHAYSHTEQDSGIPICRCGTQWSDEGCETQQDEAWARRCAECRVREPHEHRCIEGGCECPDCHPSDAELEAFRRENGLTL